MKEKTQKKAKNEKITVKKTYELYEIMDFLNKKAYFVGFIDGKQKTKKFASKMSFLNSNPSFKKAFNNSELKVIKIDAKSGGTRQYV